MWIVCLVVVALCVMAFVWGYAKYRYAMLKVWSMTPVERVVFLNKWMEPYGYYYEPGQNILLRRVEGCEDYSVKLICSWKERAKQALKRNQAVVELLCSFAYQGKTFLVLFQKGQYGIFSGANVGIWVENKEDSCFYPAKKEEQLEISLVLYQEGERGFVWGQKHFELAAFEQGKYYEIKDLRLRTRITFPTVDMALRFVSEMKKTGMHIIGLSRNATWVTVDFADTGGYPDSRLLSWRQRWVQFMNQIRLGIFNMLTVPFEKTVDKMLFLYFRYPFYCKKIMHFISR